MATVLTSRPATMSPELTGIAPIIIDLGKEKKGRIKDLKRGRGRLMAEIAGVINEVRAGMGEGADGHQLIPVVLIYKKKGRGRRNWSGGGGGGRGFFPFTFPTFF